MTPQTRASYFAGKVSALSVLGAREELARSRLDVVLKGLAGLSRVDWIPVAWDIELSQVVAELGGLGAVRAVNAQAMLLSLDRPLIRPFVSVGVSLFGLSPGTLIRLLPRIWAGTTKDLGRIEVPELKDDAGRVAFLGVPPEATADAALLEGICGIFEGILQVSGCVGRVDSPKFIDDAVCYDLSWHRR